MLTGSVIISDLFAVLTVTSVSVHGGQHADTQICSCCEFFVSVLCTVLDTTKRETSETPVFPNLVFEQLLCDVYAEAVCKGVLISNAEAVRRGVFLSTT